MIRILAVPLALSTVLSMGASAALAQQTGRIAPIVSTQSKAKLSPGIGDGTIIAPPAGLGNGATAALIGGGALLALLALSNGGGGGGGTGGGGTLGNTDGPPPAGPPGGPGGPNTTN